MRVIFLDIDGVLNSEAYIRKLEEKHRQLGHTDPTRPKRDTTCECFKLHAQIDRDAVVQLNRLVEATGSKIVISSSWRKLFDPPELHRILSEHGLVAEIIGETPDGANDSEMRETYGYIDRIFRGHEIDFWLKQHPEVDRFVILDDGGDMEMHKNRLVQTDCEEGLLADHVELAIRVMAWDGKTAPTPIDAMMAAMEALEESPMITSTRSNTNEDARRDFDGFDVDEEHRRLRDALRRGQWRVAAELAANLDEHVSRGGSLPVAWLGPACMQEEADLEARLRPSIEAAAKMAPQARQDAVFGYVAVTPAIEPGPGSSWGIHCHEIGCAESLTLARTTTVATTEADDYQQLLPALDEAAVQLGWRVQQCFWWCPAHVVIKLLACARCLSPCPECFCMGGPRSEAVDGIAVKA